MILGYIIALIVVLIVHGILSSKASDIAAEKGYDKRTWFHMCFWLGGFFAAPYIIIAAMPDKELRASSENMLKLQQEMINKLDGIGSGNQEEKNKTTYFDDLPEM